MKTSTATPNASASPRLELPVPFLHQLMVLKSPARFKLLVCGRRWAKTATGLIAALMGHGPMVAGKPMFRGAIDGAKVWWIAPTYKIVANSEIWPDLKRATEYARPDDGKSEVDKEIRLVSGGSVQIRSADSGASLRGPGLDGVVIDEAAFLSAERWREEIRPSLVDKQGWGLLQTTPNGKNWIDKLRMETAQRADWAFWQRPTSDNPLISQEELDAVRQDIGPRSFAQEHEAQFTEIEGAAFPGWYFEDHIWRDEFPSHFDVSALTIDPSMGKEAKPGDYSAIVFCGLARGMLWVWSDIQRRPPQQIVEDTLRIADRFQPTFIGCEANGFQDVLRVVFDLTCQIKQRVPLPVNPIVNTERKGVRILRLDSHLAKKAMRFIRCTGNDLLIEQLQMFPDKGYHDDGPDALEMAIRLMERATAIETVPEMELVDLPGWRD